MDDYDEDDYMMGGQMFHFRSDGKADSRDIEIREQDRYLPIANIARIMKKVLPGNAKIAKDAKEAIQECVSEFISFITSEASDKCQQEKRKTINGDDLLWAMSTLGFEKYIDPLKAYLAKYRESVKGERVADKKAPIRPPTTSLPYASIPGHLKPPHPIHASLHSHGSGPILTITPGSIIKSDSAGAQHQPKWTTSSLPTSSSTSISLTSIPNHPTRAQPHPR